MAKRIYIIEDDENIRSLLKVALASYSYEVREFEAAEQALESISKSPPDLCVFDIMLPGMDGISAVRRLRGMPEGQSVPVMMLTAKDTEADKVVGLDSGADDYMTKPFGVMELMARIRALLRRNEALLARAPKERNKKLDVLDLNLNLDTREVFKKGNQVPLTFKEYEILVYLIERKDKVVSRETLLQDIWGYDFDVETRTLDMHIRSLRQKLGDDGETYIKTVRGVGYRFMAQSKSN